MLADAKEYYTLCSTTCSYPTYMAVVRLEKSPSRFLEEAKYTLLK